MRGCSGAAVRRKIVTGQGVYHPAPRVSHLQVTEAALRRMTGEEQVDVLNLLVNAQDFQK